MARPSKYKGISSLIVRKLTEAFKNDFTVQEACFYAGIAKDTYYRWKRENEEFSYEMERAKIFVATHAKKVIAKSIMPNCIKTSTWLLNRRQRNRYTTKQENVLSTHEPLTKKEKKEINYALKMANI